MSRPKSRWRRSRSMARSLACDVRRGLWWGREPIPSLADLDVVQSTRGYEPMQITHYLASWVDGAEDWPVTTWPLEPLESTALFSVQLQAETLAQTLKGRYQYNAADVAIYNRIQDDLYNGIRDFLIAHYVLTERDDTPYWRDVKFGTEVPDSLADLLRIARMTLTDLPIIRSIYRPNFGDFSFTDGWMSILIGMNHMPLDFNQFQGAGPFEPWIGAWWRPAWWR